MDSSGKEIFGDDGLNGVELGPAVQVTRGWKPADRLAVYTGGSGSDTLSFLYVVREVSCLTFVRPSHEGQGCFDAHACHARQRSKHLPHNIGKNILEHGL